MNCLIINVDRGEYLDPSVLGDGADLHDFASIISVSLSALGFLLSNVHPHEKDHPLVGRWAHQIVVIEPNSGTSGENLPVSWKQRWSDKVKEGADPNLYSYARACMTDVSQAAMAMLGSVPGVIAKAVEVRRGGVFRAIQSISPELQAHLYGGSSDSVIDDDGSSFDLK